MRSIGPTEYCVTGSKSQRNSPISSPVWPWNVVSMRARSFGVVVEVLGDRAVAEPEDVVDLLGRGLARTGDRDLLRRDRLEEASALHAADRGDRQVDLGHVVLAADPLVELAVGVVHDEQGDGARGERVRRLLPTATPRSSASRRRPCPSPSTAANSSALPVPASTAPALNVASCSIEPGCGMRSSGSLPAFRLEHRLLQAPAARERERLGVRRRHRLGVEPVARHRVDVARGEGVGVHVEAAEPRLEAVVADVDRDGLRGPRVEGHRRRRRRARGRGRRRARSPTRRRRGRRSCTPSPSTRRRAGASWSRRSTKNGSYVVVARRRRARRRSRRARRRSRSR